MKNKNLFPILMILVWTSGFQFVYPQTGSQGSEEMPAEHRIVDSVGFSGILNLEISEAWNEEALKLVGGEYDEEAAQAVAKKLSDELGADYDVTVKMEALGKQGHFKVVFHTEESGSFSGKNDIPTPADVNVNERYIVEGLVFRGIALSKIDKTWHKNAKELVGERYNEKAANDLAGKLSDALGGNYRVEIKVEKGEKPDHVKVVFQVERIHRYFHRNAFDADIPLVVYHSKQSFSGTLEIPIRFHHNVFTFGIVSDVDQLLERNAGIRLRYEHRKVGTEKLRLRIDFNSYHQSFNTATLAALENRPDIPGIYRARQNFAPSLSLHPTADLKLTAGVSLQRLQMQYPTLRTERAYAGTADIQFMRDIESGSGYWHRMGVSYGLRTATRVLDSDFVYSRHQITGDYILSRGKHLFGAHFLGGLITGNAPLFERFSLGNSATLRGWNKFDVAPLGGNRAAHGTLEYRYSHFQLFYDFGAVWDKGMPSQAKHGLGFGLVSKRAFMSLAFPVRQRNVVPIFIMGIRY